MTLKPFAFPKAFRLCKEKDYREVFEAKHKTSTPYFWIKSQPNQKDHPRLGILVSKKKFRGPWTAIA